MKYIMFIKHAEDSKNKTIPPALYAAIGEFIGDVMKCGIQFDGAGLQPTSAGARVRVKKGKITATDGPFKDAKEIIGGYVLVDVKTHYEALTLARQFMELHRVHWKGFEGECELRPLEVQG